MRECPRCHEQPCNDECDFSAEEREDLRAMTTPIFKARRLFYGVSRAVFTVEVDDCGDAMCPGWGRHKHEVDVSQVSDEEFIAMDDESWKEAARDLQPMDPIAYSAIAEARRELLRERDEDEGKATDDRGLRIVA